MYEDDARREAVATAESFEKLNNKLNVNLVRVQEYFKSWFLTVNWA